MHFSSDSLRIGEGETALRNIRCRVQPSRIEPADVLNAMGLNITKAVHISCGLSSESAVGGALFLILRGTFDSTQLCRNLPEINSLDSCHISRIAPLLSH